MGSPPRKTPSLAVLVAISALGILPINMFVPSLPSIARDLGVEFRVVNAAIAGYAIATACTHLVAGALSDRFGRRPVALVALAVFTLASIGCSLATDIRFFLLCRLLQGTVIAGYAVSLAAIRDTAGDSGATSRIGYVSSAWALAPMVGPVVGGMLDAHFGWRANFTVFALLGIAGLGLVAWRFPETHHDRSAGIAAPLKGYGELLRSARFWALALCMAFAIGTLYVFLGGAPLVAAQSGVVSTTRLGLYMGMVPAGFLVGSYLVGRMGARHAQSTLILAGRVLTCTGLSIGLALALAGAADPLAFFLPCVAVGLGNGLTMPTANACVLSLRPGLAGTASGLGAALTVAGAGAIAFASGLVVDVPNASVAVLGAMLATASLSLAMAVFIAATDPAKAG